jgi:phasin family protein
MVSIEHIAGAQKLHADFLFALHLRAFEGLEKLVTLNVQATRAVIEEAADASRAVFAAKDGDELARRQSAFLKPAAEHAADYARQVQAIAQETWAELARVVVTTASQSPARWSALLASAVENTPAGSESAAEIVKSTVAAATTAYEGMQKAASDVMEANVQALSAAAAGRNSNGKARTADRRASRAH